MLKLTILSVRTFLLLISLLIIFTIHSVSQERSDLIQYRVHIEARGRTASGIAIMEQKSDNTIIGTLVTDFGVKIFDFSRSQSNKMKIENVISPLNKWYIRRVLRKDLSFILVMLINKTKSSALSKIKRANRTVSVYNDDTLSLTNHRYKITYSLSPITEKKE